MTSVLHESNPIFIRVNRWGLSLFRQITADVVVGGIRYDFVKD
jgi:hypothetical protein